MSRSMKQRIIQGFFIFRCPSIIIVCISTEIWRIAINQIIHLSMINCFNEVLIVEFPMICMNNTLGSCNLIADFCYICRGKSFWFFTKRNIPLATTIKSHHAIKTCTR